MPVRSLNSPVLKWPSRQAVLDAAGKWAARAYSEHPGALKIGCFGSYARGDSGVGSDLDLLVLVADEVKSGCAAGLDASILPVPADVLVFTESEWTSLQSEGGRFANVLATETVWFSRP
jgi:hypothetical protein